MRVLICICLLFSMLPAFAQEDESIDAMRLLSTLAGEWQGRLIVEQTGREPAVLKYGMQVDTVGNGDALVIRHRFHFPNGVEESVEVSSYDLQTKLLRIASFSARQRIIQDIQITEMDASQAPHNWRILGEADDIIDGKKVRVRHLYQMQDGKYSKYRWIGNEKDGFALSDTVELTRQPPR